MSTKISQVYGREVLDSRGNPTLEVELTLSDGSMGSAIVPSGASTGEHEALELRDEDPKRFLGRGVRKAVEHVNGTLAKKLCGISVSSLEEIDRIMINLDGTTQKTNLGGNTILGISLAYAHALAKSRKKPLYLVLNELMGLTYEQMRLPIPLMNILNGGMHANNGLEIQEFMIVPHGFEDFPSALRAGCEVFHSLKKNLHKRKLSTSVGDEGGFAPELNSNEEALQVITEAVGSAGYEMGRQISLALDVAASSFYDRSAQKYRIRVGEQSLVDAVTLIGYYEGIFKKYPIVSIEDGLGENDWTGWQALTSEFSNRIQLVGDDIFVTQAAFVKKGIEMRVANAVLIKVNQVGSLTETFETMELCRKNKYRAVVSHRSGETEDSTIAHLAVASGAGQIKTGSVSRSERTAKYNELLRIADRAKAQGSPIPFAEIFEVKQAWTVGSF